MNEKIGRNDPCPCGSGKKFKSCCLAKQTSKYSQGKRKITAKWVNAPSMPNLIERTFGEAIDTTGALFKKSTEVEFMPKVESPKVESSNVETPQESKDN